MTTNPTTAPKSVLDAKLVNSIADATVDVLATMAGTQAKLREVVPQKDYMPHGDISAVIGIIGENGEGMVALSFTYNLASLIVSRLLGVTPNTLSSDDRTDGIGEVVNMISGKVKASLSESSATPYKLSLPSIILGAQHEISSRPKKNPYLVIVFETEGEVFNLQVTFKQYNL
jgi:CheY-specific phosphatase CheX